MSLAGKAIMRRDKTKSYPYTTANIINAPLQYHPNNDQASDTGYTAQMQDEPLNATTSLGQGHEVLPSCNPRVPVEGMTSSSVVTPFDQSELSMTNSQISAAAVCPLTLNTSYPPMPVPSSAGSDSGPN